MKTPAFSNILKVARWEFVKHVKSPIFLVLTFVMPLLIVAVGVIGYLTEQASLEGEVNLGVVDHTGQFLPYLEAQSEGTPVTFSVYHGEPDRYDEALSAQEVDAIMVVEEDSLFTGSLFIYTDDVRDLNLLNIRGVVNGAASSYRMEQMGLDPSEIYAATAPVDIQTRTITGEDPHVINFMAPLVAGFALIISVLFTGQILMYGVIKEKRNRVVEILLSSISSLELLLGKIAGFGALSLTQIAIWIGTGLIVAITLLDLPPVSLTAAQVVPSILIFFFGYLMLASIFAAVGATMKEAEGGSQAQGMVVIIPMIPLFLTTPLFMAPNALWAKILSHMPPFIPTVVLLRMGVTSLPAWEIATSLGALILSTVLLIIVGAKVFEGTILQYDRAAGLKDLKALFSGGTKT